MRHRRSVVLAVVAATALPVATLTFAAASPARGHDAQLRAPAAASAAHLYGWTELSSGKVQSTSQIGAARAGHDLELVWVTDVGDNYQLQTRTVTSGGKPTDGATNVLPTSWAGIDDFPSIIAKSSGRLISIGGQPSTTGDDQGYQHIATSPDGKAWTVQDATLSHGGTANSSYGSDTTVDGAGKLLQVYTAESADRVSYNEGVISPEPDAPSLDPTGADTGNYVYNTGLGTDRKSGASWAVWYSNSGSKSTDGADAQEIEPSLGVLVHAPDSTNAAGQGPVFNEQRMDVAERDGGGLYAAYRVGYPDSPKVAFWRVGSTKAHIIKVGHDIQRVDVATGPGGRVWMFWQDGNSDKIVARRTNTSATRFGCASKVTTPGKTTAVEALAGAGSLGPLQLAINGGTTAHVYSTVVKACMSVSVHPGKVSRKHGGKITVRVTDAGEAIAHAEVKFNGGTYHTSKHGKVKIDVPSGLGKGKHTVAVRDHGYSPASGHVTVK